MRISWHGQSCFKLQGKDVILVTDPPSKEVGISSPRTKADIVTISHNHLSHNNVEKIKEEPEIIDTPGEYNIKGVNIYGISSFHDNEKGEKLGPNNIFVIEMEKIKVCHLGDLGHKLSDTQVEMIDGIDILMIPVGETNLISMKKVIEIINTIEPKIIIPMHYKVEGLENKLSPLSKFTDEMSLKSKKAIPKLVIKHKDLPTTESEVIILEKK
ncbi:MAG: MBL fold metallo-hydrolase [Parcubacteria group bacterium]|nr:MBL fold metallo-hydrolase [Parcubacteria group bacterium]